MKTMRKEWPRVRQYVKAGNTYFSVDLRRKHYQGPKWKNFTSRDKALDFASDIGKKVAKSGVDSIRAGEEGGRVKAWSEQCAVYGNRQFLERYPHLRERELISDRTRLGLAAAKSKGMKLGTPNPEKAVAAMVTKNKTAKGRVHGQGGSIPGRHLFLPNVLGINL